MPLSEHEQRLLEQIERALVDDDPKFASSVRTGDRRGDLVAVVSGLEPGETVVSSGAFKLRNGTAVAVNNALAPDAQLAPKPADD